MDRIERLCIEKGLRMTGQRRVIARVLSESLQQLRTCGAVPGQPIVAIELEETVVAKRSLDGGDLGGCLLADGGRIVQIALQFADVTHEKGAAEDEQRGD